MSTHTELSIWIGAQGLHVRRRVRILMLLDASDYAVISPIPIFRFHALAFLADVLSPIYDFPPMSGRILKRRSSPYFPDLQWEIDRLIGLNMVTPLEVSPVIKASRAYLHLSLALERGRAAPLLDMVYLEPSFCSLRDYFRELAGALSNIDDADLDGATKLDATWESGHMGAVIDYAEWRAKNYSTLGADRIEEIAVQTFGDQGAQLSPAAKVNLYVRYLKRAINA